jgi:broad specificity phosphatase PhoE
MPSGESRQQVAERVQSCFDDIIAHESETIGIISHTTALRTILATLVPDSDAYNLNFRNMSVTTIVQQDDGSWKITQLDDVSHLEGMPSDFFGELIESKTR